ncbi:MAG: MFS transporter [Anaerolineales bacterium]|nr:MFS transporter [Anaerolineales bacterium]
MSNVQSPISNLQSPTSNLQPPTSNSHYWRNFVCFALDYVFFGVGMAFVSQTTVLPSFVSQLTDSAPVIGLSSTIMTGAWLLPQLIAASYLADKDRKKPYLMLPAAVGRPIFLLLAAVLFLGVDLSPTLILGLFFIGLAVFMSTDALAAVAWFDILSKAIPPTRRGRLFGIAQFFSGLLTVGAGVVVTTLLGPQGPPFPHNYALLFFLAGLSFFASLVAMIFLREPVTPTQTERLSWNAFLPKLLMVLRENRMFNLVTVLRLLTGFSGMALPFYIVYATKELHLGVGAIGLFLSSQVIGGILAGFVWGYLSERSGSKIVIQCSTMMALASPLLALLMGPIGRLAGSSVIYIYSLIFVALGALNSSMMPGFINFVLELAPPEERATYIALANTLCGALLLAPFLGGWLLQATSYPVLFAVTAVGISLGLVLTFRLEEPRQKTGEAVEV